MARLPYLHAVGIGAVAGARAATPAAFLLGGASGWSRAAKLLAMSELIGDKLPVVPSRLVPSALGLRALSGAASGGAVASARGGNRLFGIACGLGGALAGAWLGYKVREYLVKQRGLPDLTIAMTEDALAMLAAWIATRPA